MKRAIKELLYGNPLAMRLTKKINRYLESLQINLSERPTLPETHRFAIVIPAYNARAFCQKNLLSVFQQRYQRYRILYIDDCSTDGTADCVAHFAETFSTGAPLDLKRNTQNKGALANLYEAIWSCDDDEIILALDGDDWLAHDRVLEILNATYTLPETWLTYGQYISYPMYRSGACEALPPHLLTPKESWRIRKARWVTSHLRTFYAGLFKQIRHSDLLWKGELSRVSWDFAMLLPMLEMALHRSRFIPDILYVYNEDHPLNDHHMRPQLQREAESYFRSLAPYAPLAARGWR